VKKEVNIYVPNAFSPNGDGTNDVFMIFAGGNSIQTIRSFLVFDRWGETVYQYYDFEPNNPVYGWDGNHRETPMNSAVFVWFAEVELIDGSVELLKGDVSLVR
jgi:gliding motility-associated-like protein